MRYVVLALAALALLALAAGAAAPADAPHGEPASGPSGAPASPARAPPASAGLSVDCASPPQVALLAPPRPHSPIRVNGNDPRQGFTVEEGSEAADRPVYRPGSGVVAGDGTEADPYVVGGWATTGILVENTTAHVRVQQNDLLYPQNWPTGSTPDPFPLFVYEGRPVVQVRNASNVTVADNLVDRRYRDQNVVDAAMLLRDSIGVTASHDVAVVDNRVRRADRPLERPGTWPVHLHVQDSRDVCLRGNDVDARPEAHQGGIRVTGSQDVRIEDHDVAPLSVRVIDSHRTRLVDNTLGETTLRESPHAILQENRWPDPDTLPGPNYRLRDPGLMVRGQDPAAWNHTIPPSNLVEGQPLVYVAGNAGEFIEEPVGQVVLGGAANVTIRDATLTATVFAGYSRNVTMENVTFRRIEMHPDSTAAVWGRNVTGLTVRESLFEDAAVEVIGSSVLRMVNTTMRGGLSAKVFVEESDGAILRRMRFPPNGYGTACATFRASSHILVEETSCRRAGTSFFFSVGTSGETARNVTFRNNTIRGSINMNFGPVRDVTIRDNVFTDWDSTRAIYVENPAEIHGNNIMDLEGVSAWPDGPEPADGRWNWWGCPEGPGGGDGCAVAKGEIRVDPWLESPNPEAGVG